MPFEQFRRSTALYLDERVSYPATIRAPRVAGERDPEKPAGKHHKNVEGTNRDAFQLWLHRFRLLHLVL